MGLVDGGCVVLVVIGEGVVDGVDYFWCVGVVDFCCGNFCWCGGLCRVLG